MTHSIRTTWILMIGIVAMLMSNYVSSAPAMAVNAVITHQVMTEHNAHDNHAVSTKASDCLPSPVVNQHSHADISPAELCSNPGEEHHSCCGSVCSNSSFPLTDVTFHRDSASQLAPFHGINIGKKQSRQQGILRPPSA
jgi:hypothetical protein